MKFGFAQNGMNITARPALGVGIGAAIAAIVSETAFAATVGLANADLLAVKVAAVSFAVWFLCHVVQVRRY
jgi:hypothetical protein